MLNADVCKGEWWVGQIRTLADRGRGYEKGSFFADVLYGQPLSMSDLIRHYVSTLCLDKIMLS